MQNSLYYQHGTNFGIIERWPYRHATMLSPDCNWFASFATGTPQVFSELPNIDTNAANSTSNVKKKNKDLSPVSPNIQMKKIKDGVKNIQC